MTNEREVPKLDLSQFVFKPPGPMGWAFNISEEEIAHAKNGILKIMEAEDRLSELEGIYELSLNKVGAKESENQVEEIEVEEMLEVQTEEIKVNEPKDNIRIILPVGPLKAPWLPKKEKKRRKKK